MSKWPTVKLGEVLHRTERFEAREELSEYQFAGTYSYARGIFVGERKLGSTFGLPRIQRIRSGEFIYCKIMAWEGAFGVAPPETDNCVMSGAFVVYGLDHDRIDPRFLDYFFKVPAHWQSIGSQSTGTNVRRKSLHPTQFENAEMPLPPLPEQRRVVARIEELSSQIHEARTLRRQATAKTQCLMASQLMQIFDAAAAGKNHQTRLGDVCIFQGGSQPAKLQFAYEPRDGYVRLIQIRDYKSDDFLTYVPTESVRKFCTRDDVMIGRYGPPIFQILRGLDGAYNVALMKAIPNSSLVFNDFLFWLLKEPRLFQKVEQDSQRTSGQTGIRRELLEDHITFVPSLPEQSRIVAELDALQAEVDALKRLQAETSSELDALLPAILDRAFKGEL